VEKNYIGIDIFSGAGGLSLGAKRAGIHIKIGIEKNKSAAKTFKRNHSESLVLTDDISNIKANTLGIKNPFIVFGGPPCQGFSLSNSKTRNQNNAKNNLYLQFVRFISELKPKWFLFENVEGLVSFNKGNTVKQIQKDFIQLGYKVKDDVLKSSDYGVPQDRNRYILVGNKQEIDFEFPEK